MKMNLTLFELFSFLDFERSPVLKEAQRGSCSRLEIKSPEIVEVSTPLNIRTLQCSGSLKPFKSQCFLWNSQCELTEIFKALAFPTVRTYKFAYGRNPLKLNPIELKKFSLSSAWRMVQLIKFVCWYPSAARCLHLFLCTTKNSGWSHGFWNQRDSLIAIARNLQKMPVLGPMRS